jgi:hypothetical protein
MSTLRNSTLIALSLSALLRSLDQGSGAGWLEAMLVAAGADTGRLW